MTEPTAATVGVRITANHGRLRVIGPSSIEPGSHVRLDLGDLNRYGWRLARVLQRLHPAATFELLGAARVEVRAEVAAYLVDGGKTITAVQGLDPHLLTSQTERPPTRASRGDRKWEPR